MGYGELFSEERSAEIVAASFAGAEDPRLRQVLGSLVRHLHAFVRDVELTEAEWGFAIGSDFWGTGVYTEAANLVLAFIFETLGSHRLEARSAVRNGRGHAALRKMGAVQEGVLRKSLFRAGEYLDQTLYAIVADEWRQSQSAQRLRVARVH